MKSTKLFLPVFLLLSVSCFAQGEEQIPDSEVLAKRGKGIVTQTTFTAKTKKIPAESRKVTLRDRKRLQDVINTLLLRAQLVEDAREAGYDKDPIVIDRMKLAADAELATAWVEHYVASKPQGDYELLAREYYELHKQGMMSDEKIDVSHILISSEERSEEEALAEAESIYKKAEAKPESFDELIMTFSDDPSSASNNGHFFNVKKGDMVKSFEEVAFALENGEISQPVKTGYGYHIIRLDAYIDPKQKTFDEVKDGIMASERNRHSARIRKNYLSTLTSLDVEMTKEALEEMVRRQFGEDYVDVQPGDEETE